MYGPTQIELRKLAYEYSTKLKLMLVKKKKREGIQRENQSDLSEKKGWRNEKESLSKKKTSDESDVPLE